MLRSILRSTICRLFGHSFRRIPFGFHWYNTDPERHHKTIGQWHTVRCSRCEKFGVRYFGDTYIDSDGKRRRDGEIM